MSDLAPIVVRTSSGFVRGAVSAVGARFRAIPFAAPPVGANRFRPPQPVEPWRDVREAVEVGPTAPQSATANGLEDYLPNVVVPGDDYLHLNLWTPDVSGSAPVVVFIYGGGFNFGSNAVSGYDGTTFARDGVVLVTINYRLGADGFLWFGDGTANLGLLDQVAALTWVRDEIAAFGGDPERVTVMGESAGAMSVAALMTMPSAQGLFHRAILESGAGHHAVSPSAARHVGRRLAKALGVAPTREAIAAAPTADLIAAQTKVSHQITSTPFRRIWGDVATNLMAFEPIVDGAVLPALPITAVQGGAGAGIDVLVGYNTQEAQLFFLDLPGRGFRVRATAVILGRNFGLHRKDIAFYRRRAAGPDRDLDALTTMLTDAVYRMPALRFAEAHAGSHVYRFGWPSPAHGGRLGAAHAVELPFVFDAVEHPDYRGMLGGDASAQAVDVAHRMHAAWVTFARTGDPGWPAYSPNQRTEMEFGGTDGLVEDHEPEVRAFWEGRR